LKSILFISSLTLSSLLFAQSGITPIPKTLSYNTDQAELGKKLFQDPILSHNGTISCASCHHLKTNGADSIQYSFGIDGKETDYNTPTVFNSIFNFVQFYDGRAKDLKEETVMGLEKKNHMGANIDEIIKKLKNSPYKEEFDKVFKEEGLKKETFLRAIVEFEKALITPNSKFDIYLRGDTTVLNDKEKRGYKEFQESGCINCHNGVNIGSNMYQKMGMFAPYSSDKHTFGRFDVTKRDRDKNVYKVPSLRNIADTAPYFHDGSVKTLKDAVEKMYEYQLGTKPTTKQVDDIVAFLKTLSAPKPKILEDKK